MYASLAALMAVGLVGAGIGSDVSGGIFDIFTSDDGADTSEANKAVEKRIDNANDKLKVNARDQAALIELIRGHYSLATSDSDPNDGTFGDDGKKELESASDAWKRYLATKPEKVDPALASLMINTYSELGLNQPENAVIAAELIAEQRNDSSAYIQLVQFATQAGQQRKADLAAEKALELAPKEERDTVKALLEQAKAAQPPAGEGGTGQAPAPGGG